MKINWKKGAEITVCTAGMLAAAYLLLRILPWLVMPFLPAFLLSLLTHPVAVRLGARTGWRQRTCACLVTLFSLVILLLFGVLICSRLLTEAQNLLQLIIEDSADPHGEIAKAISFFRGLGERLPFLSRLQNADFLQSFIGDPQVFLTEQLRELISSLGTRLATLVAGILRRLPGVLFFAAIFLISCFYFALEYDAVIGFLKRLVPPSLKEKIPLWRARFCNAAKRCVRAYFLLFLLTFFELAAGFFMLRIKSPILLALLTAFLDILPVLGVGVLLIPFALFCLVSERIGQGIGLLVLYAVITVVRQIAEPRLVGKSLGLHPLLMLISFYAGLRLFGGIGILLGPLSALLLKAVLLHIAEEKREGAALK